MKSIPRIHPLQVFILLVVGLLTVFIVKYFAIREEHRTILVEVINRNWLENYDFYGSRTPYWLSDKIKPGLVEHSSSGKIIARLLSVDNFERGSEETETFLTVDVIVINQKRLHDLTYKNLSLAVGSAIDFKFGDVFVRGQVIDNHVPPQGFPTKTFTVISKLRNAEPWIVSQIKTGLVMKNRSTNTPVLTITEVKIEPPSANYAFLGPQGYLMVKDTSLQKDVYITAKLTAYQLDNRWYFAGHQNLKVGNPLYIFTDTANFIPEITEISP